MKIFTQLYEGDGLEICKESKEFNFKCCKCGLVHKIKIKHKKESVVLFFKEDKNQAMGKSLFVRFGDIPVNGKSGVYNGDAGKVKEEEGVSVYEAIKKGNKYKIILPSITSSACVSLEWVIKRPLYLVKGKPCGYGSDGEPLLKNCKIIKQLKEIR